MSEAYEIQLGIGLNDSDFESIKSKIKALEKDDIKIKLDTNTIDAQIKGIETKLKSLDNIKINLGTEIKIDGNVAIRSAQQTGQKIGTAISNSVKQSVNIDDVIDKQVADLMNKFAIAGDKGSNAFNEIRQALVECRNELNILKNGNFSIDEEVFGNTAAVEKVTKAIANQIQAVNNLSDEYVELANYMTRFNDPAKGNKVRLPSVVKQEQGDDYRSNRSSLGIAFNTERGISFVDFINDLNQELGETISLTNGETAAMDELLRKLEIGRKQRDAIGKSERYLTSTSSTEEILAQNGIHREEIYADTMSIVSAIDSAEKQIAQSSVEATNIVVQNEERKQQAYRETANVYDSTGKLDTFKKSLQNIGMGADEINSVASRISNLGVQIESLNQTRSYAKDKNILSVDISGLDEMGNAIKLTQQYDIATGDLIKTIDRVSTVQQKAGASTNNFAKQQKQAVSNLTNQAKQLHSSAIDQNASRPIKETAHLDALESKYKEIGNAIEAMGNASSEAFAEEQIKVKNLISDYKIMKAEFKNAENVSSSLKGTDFASGLEIAKNNLEKFKAQARDFPQITSTIEELDKAIANVGDKSSLDSFTDQLKVARAELAKVKAETIATNRKEKVGIDVSGATSRIANIQRISPEIDEFKAKINGAEVTVESLLNDLSKVNTAGDFSVVNKRLNAFEKAAESAGIAVKETVSNTKSDFNKLKSLLKEAGRLELDITTLDHDKNSNEIYELARQIKKVQKEFVDLFTTKKDNLSNEQIEELTHIYDTLCDKVDRLDAKMADTSAIQETEDDFKKLLAVFKQFNNINFKINKLDAGSNSNEISELTSQLLSLRRTYRDLRYKLTEKLSNNQLDAISSEAQEAGNKLAQLDAKFADAKKNLAGKIKINIELGTFDNQISQMEDEFNRLQNSSTELRDSVKEVKSAYREMNIAYSGTGNEVADRERLIQAEEKYANALKKTKNLLKIQAREDRANANAQKLQDNRELFQSKIDVWMEKNSAATKKFGADLLSLRAKAQSADQVELNHLEKELQKIDKAADKAGLKMQSIPDKIRSKAKEYMAYFSVAEIFMETVQAMKRMFETVVEIDTAMTGLYRVTDLTASQYDALFDNMVSSAKEYGATLTDIINATTDWVRAGFEADKALGLAEVTTMYQHISDLDYDTAAENLITAYNGFKDELNTAFSGDEVAAVEYIADIFNELDKQNCP